MPFGPRDTAFLAVIRGMPNITRAATRQRFQVSALADA
jgi:hypothetical protein